MIAHKIVLRRTKISGGSCGCDFLATGVWNFPPQPECHLYTVIGERHPLAPMANGVLRAHSAWQLPEGPQSGLRVKRGNPRDQQLHLYALIA
jgi:hypothetical protein